MKTTLKLVSLSLILAGSGFGAVYNVKTNTGTSANGIASSGGLANDPSGTAPAGTYTGFQNPSNPGVVAYGIFSSLDDGGISGATSLNTLVSAFVQFGDSGTFNSAGPTNAQGIFTRNTGATVGGTSFDGSAIYVFAGNGTTFANSTELLVLKLNSSFTAAQDLIPTAQDVFVSSATATLLFGINLADVRTTGTDSTVTAGWGTTTAVPEPSIALLGALGVFGLIRRRR